MHHTNRNAGLASLIVPIKPIPSSMPMEEIAELFIAPEYADVLSLPVVDDNIPVGMISRHRFMNVYLNKRFGRELYSKRSISHFMNKHPLVVSLEQSLTEAAQHVASKMEFPLTEDFIIASDGTYVGISFVVNLLKAMELQLRSNTDELNRAYSQLKSSQMALVQSEKMASLGQMVAGVAHEINTPLGYVQNNVTMGSELFPYIQATLNKYETLFDHLMNGQVSEEQLAQQMQQISEARSGMNMNEMLVEMQGLMADSLYGLEQISELVMNLKDFSRVDAAMTDTVNLHDCIESALNIGRNVLKGKLEVIKLFGEIPPIACAPSQLNQVFLNLFTNAAQATEGCGTLTISTWRQATMVHVAVQDSGKGIAPEHLPRVFDPFFTTKPVGEGTGLGLAIAFQIIEKHGGKILVASEIGKGTRFEIQLPVSTAPHSAANAQLTPA